MKKAFHSSIAFGVPFLLWILLFQPFLMRQAVLSAETFHIYSLVKYFWDNIMMGVFPSWNPFILCGLPMHILLNYVGIFNPLWLLVPVLKGFGLSIYLSFVWTAVVYYFIGQIGFYLLAKELLGSARAAYVAFLLFFFSSFSLFMLLQYHPVLFYVPSVWFFYFLCRFCRRQEKFLFVGMMFTVMLISSVYLPLYFLTVFLLVGILAAGLYPRELQGAWKGLWTFCRAHKTLTILCVVALLIALSVSIRSYQSTSSHEVIATMRSAGEAAYKTGASFSNFKETTDGALSARMSLGDLYSHLDQIEYGNDGIFYVPIFAYLILFLTIFNKFNRKIVFFALLSLALLLLCLSDITPVHEFLYTHVFYFKFLRNLHFFLPFLLSAFVLLTAEQFRRMTEDKASDAFRGFWVGFVVLVHLGVAVFLFFQEKIIVTSYLSILFSLIFWIVFLWRGQTLGNPVFVFLLSLSVLVQPAEVFWQYNHRAIGQEDFIKQYSSQPAAQPRFSYLRPASFPGKVEPLTGHIFQAWYQAAMIDSPGIVPYLNGFLPYWAYFTSDKIPSEIFQAYTRHKFLIYDHVELIGSSADDIERVVAAWQSNSDTAFVAREEQEKDLGILESLSSGQSSAVSRALILDGPVEGFKVVSFGANFLKVLTDFPQEKFLVYNDNYFRGWKASLNGQRVPVYRANIAFKGVRLPAGPNELTLIYDPSGPIDFFIWAVFLGVFGWMVLLFYRKKNRTDVNVRTNG